MNLFLVIILCFHMFVVFLGLQRVVVMTKEIVKEKNYLDLTLWLVAGIMLVSFVQFVIHKN